jgi:curved DNA-binding protein CbpA
MLAGPSAWGYGPVIVTASADDVLPAQRRFAFNYETDQMLFDEETS